MGVLSLLDHYSNDKIDSHFRIVIIGVQRAKQLLGGATPTCEKPFAKETSRAIYEVVHDDVAFVVGTEARLFKKAQEHAQAKAAETQPLENTTTTPASTTTPPATKTIELPAEKAP